MNDEAHTPWWRTPFGMVLCGFLIVADFFLLTEHRFILVMFGFLLQWPTLLTLAMFPVLVFMHVRLARTEEPEALAEFGAEYEHYMREVPGFIPRLTELMSGAMHGHTRQE
jgi:protein-S-isoprenylcysteine O-methyltransferase Ste14